MCVHAVITDEEANAALIGSTVGVAAFLVIAGIIFFSILFGVRTHRKNEKWLCTLLMISSATCTEGGN